MSNRMQKHRHAKPQRLKLGHFILDASGQSRLERAPCLGGCGRSVLRTQGECSHCRRRRVHKGLKLLRKLGKVAAQMEKK